MKCVCVCVISVLPCHIIMIMICVNYFVLLYFNKCMYRSSKKKVANGNFMDNLKFMKVCFKKIEEFLPWKPRSALVVQVHNHEVHEVLELPVYNAGKFIVLWSLPVWVTHKSLVHKVMPYMTLGGFMTYSWPYSSEVDVPHIFLEWISRNLWNLAMKYIHEFQEIAINFFFFFCSYTAVVHRIKILCKPPSPPPVPGFHTLLTHLPGIIVYCPNSGRGYGIKCSTEP